MYVVWHPDSNPAEELAHALFRHVCQDPENPLEWGLQIPVRFRSKPGGDEQRLPAPIPLDESDPASAQYTAIVVLVDLKMLLDRKNWGPYVAQLSHQCDTAASPHRLFPVMVSEGAHKLDPTIAREQFIRIPDDQAQPAFLNRVTHELCRLILNKPRVNGGMNSGMGAAPVKVFLSHAKRDGKVIAESIRDYIGGNMQMKSFFDAVDIPAGSKWADVLDESTELALLAIHTDAYATRPWCQREVLNAKERGTPVVVLNALNAGEKRSFPYLGNTPTVRWQSNDPSRFEQALGVLLKEVLRNTFFKNRLQALFNLYQFPTKPVVLANHPELLTALHLCEEGGWQPGELIIYPDPPIASEELARLMALEPKVRLITPSMLPAYAEAHSL